MRLLKFVQQLYRRWFPRRSYVRTILQEKPVAIYLLGGEIGDAKIYYDRRASDDEIAKDFQAMLKENEHER